MRRTGSMWAECRSYEWHREVKRRCIPDLHRYQCDVLGTTRHPGLGPVSSSMQIVVCETVDRRAAVACRGFRPLKVPWAQDDALKCFEEALRNLNRCL